MRSARTRNLLTAAVGLATLVMGARAEAAFTISLASVTPSGGEYIYNYTAQITAGDEIRAGDFFRIYDFYGYVPGSISAPAGWTASTALTNPTPPPNVIISLGDDPTIPNLIFTYTGATPIGGPLTLTGFVARSTSSFTGLKNFAGRNTKSDGPSTGTPGDSVGEVTVPVVPEPTALVPMSLGAAILGLLSRRRVGRSA